MVGVATVGDRGISQNAMNAGFICQKDSVVVKAVMSPFVTFVTHVCSWGDRIGGQTI